MVRLFALCASLAVLSACAATEPVPASAPTAAAASIPEVAPTGSAPVAPSGALANGATITVSASTNTPKLVIIVGGGNDVARWQISGAGQKLCRSNEGDVALGGLGTALLNGIPSDTKLKDLPVGSCSKPASFRTTTTLEHFLDTSGDLSCPSSDPTTTAVAQKVEAVKKAVLAGCNLPLPQ